MRHEVPIVAFHVCSKAAPQTCQIGRDTVVVENPKGRLVGFVTPERVGELMMRQRAGELSGCAGQILGQEGHRTLT